MLPLAKSIIAPLPAPVQRALLSRARPLKYHFLWAILLKHAAKDGVSARDLARVRVYLRSHYDKGLFPKVDAWQNPKSAYFPGLRPRPVYDSKEFAWTAVLEQSYSQIKSELVEAIRLREPNPHPQNLVQQGTWKAVYFYVMGKEVEEVHRLCPVTASILRDSIPFGPTSQVFFSVLSKKSHISPHCGPVNTRLTCHLGLITAPNSFLRVGSQILTWEEGKCLIFDDSFEHEAWNNSDMDRIILLIQFWHPDLSEPEIWALKQLRQFIYDPEYKESVLEGKRK